MRYLFKTDYRQDLTIWRHRGDLFWYGLLCIALLAIPFVLSEFYVGELGGVFIFAVAGVLTSNMATGLACVGVMILFNASYLAVLGWLFIRPTPRRIYARFRRAIEGTIGTLFIFFGARLLFKELARA